ncbi:homeobox domain-containing protein [Caerostris extrusa]|nr:homeobox domain-containing protein [Caerostris extrusa]
MNVHSSYQTSFSTTLPIGKWSPGSMSSSSSSFNYQTLSNEVTESDSSSTIKFSGAVCLEFSPSEFP